MATEKKAPAAKTAKPKAAKPAPAAATETKAAAPADSRNPLQKRREVTGTVVSNKMTKTIVVKVDRIIRHGLFKKYLTRSARFKAHDETNTANPGDLVVLVESRPMSREKRWVLQRVIRRAGQAPDVNV